MTLALFAALIKIYDGYITPLGATAVRCWKSDHYPDGHSDEDFLVGLYKLKLDRTELEITMRFSKEHWNKFNCLVLPRARHWQTDEYQVIEKLGQL